MSKHTPGKWTIKEYDDHMGRFPDNERRQRTVIDVIAPSDERDPKYPRIVAACGEDGQANARLIAAAPEMLELLQKIAEEDRRPLSTRLHFEVTELLSRLDSE